MKYRDFEVEKDYNSIYIYLKEHGFSENYIKNLRKVMGYIKINDNDCNIRQALSKGDKLSLNASPNQKTDIVQCILPLDIVYEDEYYLLIDKPSGISCMPNRSHYAFNLAGAIMGYMKDKDDSFVLRIINRLDKDTSGIIIVAKDSIAQKEIKKIYKTYHAICTGAIHSPISIDKPIKTLSNNGINEHRRIISPDGQSAITHVIPIKSSKDLSLISLKLEHGRTHQIRLHLSSIGHSLLGDELYGEKSSKISHTALVCKELSFFHPYLNKTLHFEIKYPEDIKNVIAVL